MSKAHQYLKFAIIIVIYLFILTIFSNSFDLDFGWHLRFGKELWQNSGFPYTDTYTYPHLGQNWVNHEWGGDALYWLIYNNFSYLGFLLILAAAPLTAFLLSFKIFKNKITPADAVIAFILLWSVQHIIIARLTVVSPLLFVVLWYWLEKLSQQKNYYLWPFLFWIWAALHGSWILGFITIAIYIAGNIVNLICQKYKLKWYQTNLWTIKEIKLAIIWSIISAATILLNPYGFGIYKEVIGYFTEPFFRAHITEWIPSYTFPIYWKTLLVMGLSLPLVVKAFYKNKITWPQLLLYGAFWYSAWQYKRNALLFVLICAPLFSAYWEIIKTKITALANWQNIISSKIFKTSACLYSIFAILLLGTFYLMKANFSTDIWTNHIVLEQAKVPVAGIKFLQQKIGQSQTYIFNEFAWGGYLNWTMPNALVFLDGRGTATWKTPTGGSFLEYYQKLIYDPGGLKIIESGPARYVILSKINNQPEPDLINKIIFREDLVALVAPPHQQLSRDLNTSTNWKLIYSDRLCNIWKRLPLSQN